MMDSWSAFVVMFDSCEVTLHYISIVCSALFKIKKSNVKVFSPSILHILRFLASISPSVVLHGLTGVTHFHTSPCIWVNWSAHPDRLNYLSLSFLCLFFFLFYHVDLLLFILCVLSTESPPVSEDLLPCKICGRRFFSKVLVSISEWMISWQLVVDVNYLAIQMCVQT